MREPIFRVKLTEQGEQTIEDGGSYLGFEWIELLAVYPFRIGPTELSESIEDRDEYRDFDNWALCRTPGGITRLSSNELMDEIENGMYAEDRNRIDK